MPASSPTDDPADAALGEALGRALAEPRLAARDRESVDSVPMFHAGGGLYFGRKPDGSVRLLHCTTLPPGDFPTVLGDYPGAEFDASVDPATWCSAVLSVCGDGCPDAEPLRKMLEALHAGADLEDLET